MSSVNVSTIPSANASTPWKTIRSSATPPRPMSRIHPATCSPCRCRSVAWRRGSRPRRQASEERPGRRRPRYRRPPPLRPTAQELGEPEAGAGSDQDPMAAQYSPCRGEIEPARHPDKDAGCGDAQERRQPTHDWRARPGVLPLRRNVGPFHGVVVATSFSHGRLTSHGRFRIEIVPVGRRDNPRWVCPPRPPGRAAGRRTRRSRARRERTKALPVAGEDVLDDAHPPVVVERDVDVLAGDHVHARLRAARALDREPELGAAAGEHPKRGGSDRPRLVLG